MTEEKSAPPASPSPSSPAATPAPDPAQGAKTVHIRSLNDPSRFALETLMPGRSASMAKDPDDGTMPDVPLLHPNTTWLRNPANGLLHPPAPSAFLSPEQMRNIAPQAIVRGGTTTTAYDNALAKSMADADKRRAADDADKKLAKVPVEQGGAMMFEREFAPRMTSPKVRLRYVGKTRETIMEQLCELVVDDSSGREEHLLIFVCPECFRRGVPSGFAQCHVKASHRKWHVDTKEAGQIKAVRNSDAPGGQEFYTNAGTIMDTDVLRCDNTNCGCAFKIHNNVMYRV